MHSIKEGQNTDSDSKEEYLRSPAGDDDLDKSLTKVEEESSMQLIIRALKISFPYPLFIWVIYVFTFMLFPGIGVFSEVYFGLEFAWSGLLLLTIYNLGDIFGKWVAGFR